MCFSLYLSTFFLVVFMSGRILYFESTLEMKFCKWILSVNLPRMLGQFKLKYYGC